MEIVIFTHPDFLGSQSMPRYANMIAEGMRAKGHNVAVWHVKSKLSCLPVIRQGRKWLGYFDQYVLFPREVKARLKDCSDDTLFVFTDHALGPWVPLIKGRPHVIHCHDFLAQRSASGEVPENPVSLTGRIYQAWIRKGYRQGQNFISVSNKTQDDLHHFMAGKPRLSVVVYNGLNRSYVPGDISASRSLIGKRTGQDLSKGYILHVGGNQWYKNRTGVIEIYNAWRSVAHRSLPLLLLGKYPSEEILKTYSASPYKNDIFILPDIEDEFIGAAYSGSVVFLYPSLAEGFGWPIAEAMASGALVITTNEAPMTEVAGDAAFLIPRRPHGHSSHNLWARESAILLESVISLSDADRARVVKAGVNNAKRFDAGMAVDKIEQVYLDVLNNYT